MYHRDHPYNLFSIESEHYSQMYVLKSHVTDTIPTIKKTKIWSNSKKKLPIDECTTENDAM